MDENHKALVLPVEGFVRLADVLKVVPVSRSAWYAGMTSGRYPKPVQLGPRTAVYRVEDIRKLISDVSGTT